MDYSAPGSMQLRKGRFSQPGGIYFITVSTFQRAPRFKNFCRACAVNRQLHAIPEIACCDCLCWVVMPDHVHFLIQLGELPLNRVIQRFKSRSAVQLNRAYGAQGRFWSNGYWDHALRRNEGVQSVSDYIIYNPVRAGIVQHPAEYPFWDKAWL